jgi:hypothetical protein
MLRGAVLLPTSTRSAWIMESGATFTSCSKTSRKMQSLESEYVGEPQLGCVGRGGRVEAPRVATPEPPATRPTGAEPAAPGAPDTKGATGPWRSASASTMVNTSPSSADASLRSTLLEERARGLRLRRPVTTGARAAGAPAGPDPSDGKAGRPGAAGGRAAEVGGADAANVCVCVGGGVRTAKDRTNKKPVPYIMCASTLWGTPPPVLCVTGWHLVPLPSTQPAVPVLLTGTPGGGTAGDAARGSKTPKVGAPGDSNDIDAGDTLAAMEDGETEGGAKDADDADDTVEAEDRHGDGLLPWEHGATTRRSDVGSTYSNGAGAAAAAQPRRRRHHEG